MQRNQEWLERRLNQIWELLFNDVPRKNRVKIKFKGKSKSRFGYIKKEEEDTLIAINSLFQNELVPEYIIDVTIAHELVHYMHGFHSPLPKMYKHPHKGNIVDKELIKKGFSHMLKLEKTWIKTDWEKVYKIIIS